MSLVTSDPPKTATARGRYLYAVVDDEDDGRAYDYNGLDGTSVYTIGDGRLSAVVSDLPNQKLRPERRRVAAHHDVLRRLMADRTVLPMAFGVLADGPDAVRRILRLNHEAFVEQFDRVRGRIEMGLRVALDVPSIIEHMLLQHAELRAFRDRIFRGGREPSQDEKIDLGRSFDRILNSDREQYLQQISDALQPHVAELHPNPARTEKEMVNLACLVDRDLLPAFEQSVLDVARRFDNNFAFDINGPWPPHNFVDIQLELS